MIVKQYSTLRSKAVQLSHYTVKSSVVRYEIYMYMCVGACVYVYHIQGIMLEVSSLWQDSTHLHSPDIYKHTSNSALSHIHHFCT